MSAVLLKLLEVVGLVCLLGLIAALCIAGYLKGPPDGQA